jgi:hypothetical protein
MKTFEPNYYCDKMVYDLWLKEWRCWIVIKNNFSRFRSSLIEEYADAKHFFEVAEITEEKYGIDKGVIMNIVWNHTMWKETSAGKHFKRLMKYNGYERKEKV